VISLPLNLIGPIAVYICSCETTILRKIPKVVTCKKNIRNKCCRDFNKGAYDVDKNSKN
jgi:hypothetical protein